METVDNPGLQKAPISGSGSTYAVDSAGGIGLLSLRYAMKTADIAVADQPFEAAGRHFQAGSLLINGPDSNALQKALTPFNLQSVALSDKPSIRTHPASAPKIAFMHTWLFTQTEGWWRSGFDRFQVPYDYISTQTVAKEENLRAKYDVIIFAPVAHVPTSQIVNGMPMWGNAMPWQNSTITPNLGKIDSTEDMRPGLGFTGLAHLKQFVEEGGLLITSEDTAQFAIDEGFAPGVFTAPLKTTKVDGSVLAAVLVDQASPVAYGYGKELAVYSQDGLAFTVSNLMTNRNILTEKEYKRPTGRGGPQDEDRPEGRANEATPALPSPKPWEATALNEEQSRNNPLLIPAEYRPNVILRFADRRGLLLSGLLEGGDSIAERAVVVNAHLGKGNVLLFANNPVYRGETIGSYGLVFNAILNFDHLQTKP